jgi:hypothetical protein
MKAMTIEAVVGWSHLPVTTDLLHSLHSTKEDEAENLAWSPIPSINL